MSDTKTEPRDWQKTFFPHIGVIVLAVVVGGVVVTYLPGGLFWNLLLGLSLLFTGKKLMAVEVVAVKLWGKLIRVIGFVVLCAALINSGIRAIAEKSVNWADERLTELAEGKSNSSAVPIIGDGKEVRFNLTTEVMKDEHTVGVFDTLIVTSRRYPRADGKTIYLPCGTIVAPALVASATALPVTQFRNTSQPGRFENHLVFTEDTKRFLVENKVAKVRVQFESFETTVSALRESCKTVDW